MRNGSREWNLRNEINFLQWELTRLDLTPDYRHALQARLQILEEELAQQKQ
jgi:Trp operon repressor